MSDSQEEEEEENVTLPPSLGHFTIIRKIGEGGYGSTYLVERTTTREKKCIKIIDMENLSEFVD